MEELKRIRKEKGLKQHELADMIGAEQHLISRYERGYNKPSWSKLKLICQALDCTATDLLGF